MNDDKNGKSNTTNRQKNNNNTPTPQNLLKRAVATRKTTISVIYCAISTDGVNLAAGL